ncbi:hypothetical protein POSPLADRAFT_1047403 [Postia placenta MAD-698-R-SB12]|uniref:Sorting nexin protein WASP-binding domain-containing protein n=1 Tax=Postia placenta MAD-698-R-SB12 TaxID=670580 RepID=A0A1X6MY19_9APHY|nr:hypothetical protein POSPLADRAFT_1047403 [Postia placenta MAD-698-R-SB12]OSX61140.1 hypothetical protein POSPLADRAFT_1047403 [Postia placenta MAD-698-R-SB12]
MSKAERLLSYLLLSLITSRPLASASPNPETDEDEDEDKSKAKGHMNEDGAWCWRENCEGAQHSSLTKALQKTSETLQNVADLYDDHARRTQLATHEALKGVAHPEAIYAPVIDTHRSTLSRYHEAIRDGEEDEEVAARCETVLNTTMAEMETYHTQKVEDFQTLAKEHLDGEIALYEQILTRLRTARAAFDAPQYTALSRTPRQPSMHERELEHPRLVPEPLTQPCPHVFDSAPIRPVSVAIQEGVGMLLGGVAPAARGSVFGKLWRNKRARLWNVVIMNDGTNSFPASNMILLIPVLVLHGRQYSEVSGRPGPSPCQWSNPKADPARRRVPSIATARSTARADTDVGRAQAGVPDLWLLPEEALRGLGARRRLHETQTGVEPAECKNGEDCADE